MAEKLQGALIVALWLLYCVAWFWAILLIIKAQDDDDTEDKNDD